MRQIRLGRQAVAAGAVLAATAAVLALPASASASVAADKAPEAKLSSTLESQFGKSGTTDFWVRFSDKANLEPAKSIKDWTKRGQYVVDALQQTATASQAATVAELKDAKASYKTYAISNAILVKDAPESLALKLAASTEVSKVIETSKLQLVEPVKEEPSTKAPQGVEWGIDFIHAPEAWAQGATGAGITVASVDTGVQYDHPALVNQYRGNNHDGTFTNDYNWFDSDGACSGAPCDNAGHGTHTMGTMVGDDGAGNQIGVAPQANWIEANGCDSCEDTDLLDSGWWLLAPTDHNGQNPDVSKRPQVINNSWGLTAAGAIDPFFDDINTAWNASGIFASWAAGNSGSSCQTTSSPGANTLTYSSGAVDSSGNIAYFSSRGPGQDGMTKPNIAAPGVNIRSSLPGGTYGAYDGTSMAAPHTAGAVAALWSYNPTLVGDVDQTRALLNEAADDADDTTCGGTAANNNVYGEGYLDLERLISLAPIEGGTVAGTVTSGGEPVAGASVLLDGTHDRTLTTGEDGTFSADVTVGDYTVTASAFGYVTETSDATVTEDATTTVDFDLDEAPKFTVSGTVTNASTNTAVAGVKVSLAPGNLTATSGADGSYTLTGVPVGTYTISTAGSGCSDSTSAELVVSADKTHNIKVVFNYDDSGYYCSEGSDGVRHGDTALGLEGDDISGSVPLPFAFPFYGDSYSTAYVASNGHLNFLGANTSYGNTTIPSSTVPNAAIYPFWDDLDTRGDADVYTSTTTVDGVDAFVIEWRDVYPFGSAATLLDFSVTLFADGRVELGYGDLPDDQRAKGNSATIGIENAAGSVASQFSFNTALLSSGKSITYDVAPQGTLSGVIKDYNTKTGIGGAAVTITPAAGGTAKTVTTGADGSYDVDLVTGKYAVAYTADDYVEIDKNVTITEDTTLTSSVQLKAGQLAVTQTSLAANLAMGGTVSKNLKITNTGSAPVDVDLSAAGENVVILGDKSAASSSAIKGVEGATTELKAAPSSKKSTSKGSLKAPAGKSSAGSRSAAPDGIVAPLGDTTITHSGSQAVEDALACNNGSGTFQTSLLRTFTLDDFGITGAFNVSNISFGVHTAEAGQAVTVNLYTLNGDDFVYANLTKIGTAQKVMGGSEDGTIVNVPVTGKVSAGSTLVVETVIPDQSSLFYFGTNDDGETAPTWIAKAPQCGADEPITNTEAGVPELQFVLNVTGSTTGGGISWLDIQPPSFTLAPGKSVTAIATFDATVDQPGTYTADVVVGENTPYTVAPVPATMTVKAPAGWGKITGTVTGAGDPLEGAVVHLDGASYDVTLRTDADGTYSYWMQKSNAPLQVTVSADGYVPATKKAQIVAGQTTVYDFDLDEL